MSKVQIAHIFILLNILIFIIFETTSKWRKHSVKKRFSKMLHTSLVIRPLLASTTHNDSTASSMCAIVDLFFLHLNPLDYYNIIQTNKDARAWITWRSGRSEQLCENFNFNEGNDGGQDVNMRFTLLILYRTYDVSNAVIKQTNT